MKRLLILGGSDLQVSLIKQAKSIGHYVITCDFLPNNPGHKFADEYHNVSTTNKEEVYELAKKLNLDGILAYASDPAAPTAAWVCEKLDLPTNSFEAVNILARKDLFRAAMRKYGFKTPKTIVSNDYEEVLNFFKENDSNAIIKPVDASGSKGVFEIEKGEDFKNQFDLAISFSRKGFVIIEEIIEKKGFQIGGDGFLVEGKLVFRCFGDIHFSKTNKFLPCAVSVPTMHSNNIVTKVHDEIQKLLSAIGMTSGGLNFDVIIDKNDEVNIIEIGPRNGGNLLPELIEYCTGVDMKKYAIKTALGEDCRDLKMTQEDKYFSHYVIHSQQTGKLLSYEKTAKLNQHLLYEHYNMKNGDLISKFENSSNRLGMFLLKYENKEEMLDIIYNMDSYFKMYVDNALDDKVELRTLIPEDAFTSVKWRNNPKIWELTLNSPDKKITIEDELNWINKVISENDSKRFAILFNNRYVGNIQLTNINNSESYYGVFIGETDYWYRGIAKKATLLIIEFAFNKLKLQKVKLRVRVEHINAYNLYLKIGFKEIDRDEKLIYMEIASGNLSCIA